MDIDGDCYGEIRPLNLTPQSSSPFIRRFNQFNSDEFNPSRCKRRKTFSGGNDTYGVHAESKYNRDKSLPDVLDYSDPFSVPNLMEELGRGVYGSVTKDVEDLHSRWNQLLNPLMPFYPSLSSRRLDFSPQTPKSGLHTHDLLNGQGTEVSPREVIDLDDDCAVIDSPAVEELKPLFKLPDHVEMLKVDRDLQNHNDREILILDSDEEENAEQSGTKQASRCSPENIRFEVPQTPEQQNHNILDLDRGKSRSLLTHVDTTSHEVYDDQHHIVPCNALDVNWKASLHYQGVDENPVKDHAVGGTEQASRCSLEETRFEDPQTSQQQNHDNLDLDRGKSTSLLAHLDTTSHKAYDAHHHIVPGNALDANWKASLLYQGVVSKKPIDENPVKDRAVLAIDGGKSKVVIQEEKTLNAETQSEKDKGVYVGVHDDTVKSTDSQYDSDDGLGDIWREMTVALECNKDAAVELAEQNEDEQGEECDHSFLLKDDLGYVCRVCGVIRKSIETIFDYQWVKGSKTSRMYTSEHRSMKEKDEDDVVPFSGPSGSHYLAVVEMSVHPRYMKLMKPHQLEGFNFLVRNLISDDPGGCILAHAPGSGKTFMIISFIQSFLTKFPDARPLVVLPKGILGTWKKEFIKWQVEEIPLYDFYSAKAESRADQLVILKEWVEQKGVLFLGYQQFANIVCKNESNAAAACQDILLRVPTILICDEGHTPRNQDTDILLSLKKVHTPRKVVLSGTLYQNHVQEVFNILNLVRPNFLKTETSKTIRRRVMSRGEIGRKQHKAGADAAFYEVVEDTLQNDENSKRKVAIIQDLREMTKNVLHYYKGDFLEELPGLVDFTVLLNLSPKQKQIVNELRKLEKFKRTSIGTAVYLHPLLKEFSEEGDKSCNNTTIKPKLEKSCNINEAKMNDLIDKMDIRDGIKTKFFLNILGLCESSGEKLLVFSQYLIPLKFLERLVVKRKGWSPGKEIFMINGDTSNEDRESSMELFNNSSDAKVFFGSIKACGEGISLVGASRILILDVHLNPSVTRQAIGRAFRPGQVRKVYVYRLVAADSPEEESHSTSCRKDIVSKMWFEWSEYCGYSKFEMETISFDDSDDTFWDSHPLREDVKEVKKR